MMLKDGNGILEIGGKLYPVLPIRVAGYLAGYKFGPYEICTITELPRCNCPAFMFCKGPWKTCKHVEALTAALEQPCQPSAP